MTSGRTPDPTRYHAILGGAFDPIHLGHLNIARHLARLSHIEAVVFVPVRNHNFKRNGIALDWESRHSLISKVLEPGMLLWDCDSRGTGYTSDLMQGLTRRHPDKRFIFVIGADNIAALPQWHAADWLRHHTRFLAVCRPGYTVPRDLPPGFHIEFADVPPLDVSSTEIRARIAAGLDISEMVPETIAGEVVALYKPKGER